MEALMKTMQEGCHAIFKAVVERKMKARGPGQPQGKAKPSKTPAAAYGVKDWMWGLEGASNGKPKWNNNIDHRTDQWSIHSQWEDKVKGGIGGREPQGFLENL